MTVNGVHNFVTVNPKRAILYKTSKIFSHTDYNITVRCMPYCQYIAIVIPPTYVITWQPRNMTFTPTSAEVFDGYFAHSSSYLPIRLPLNLFCGPGSVVGIATGYGWTVRGSNSGEGEIFRTCPYRPPGPTQPPVQWVPGPSWG